MPGSRVQEKVQTAIGAKLDTLQQKPAYWRLAPICDVAVELAAMVRASGLHAR